MKCPVCGEDCVKDAHEIIDILPTIFQPCADCKGRILNKQKPLPELTYAEPCSCKKRFIDEVFAHIYVIMREEGLLGEDDPLAAVGSPLVHPGFAMTKPPYLPEKSLVLLSRLVSKPCAERIFLEVPEVRGVIRSGVEIPGISDIDQDGIPDTYELLAGCDVRANVFYTQHKPVVVYKQQSYMHIEFPRGYDPKIINVGVKVTHHKPKVFVDACSGVGTLGIIAAQYGTPHVIMNDIWFAAAFWSAYNIRVNRENLDIDDVKIFKSYEEMRKTPVVREAWKVAETEGGSQRIEVYQADFRNLYSILPESVDLSVIDLYEKNETEKVQAVIEEWRKHVSGDVFIP